MKTTNLKTFFGVILGSTLLTSCAQYDFSYRIVDSNKKSTFEITGKPSADLKIDINKKVTATSESQPSAEKAKAEAYYNAIINNNIHFIVDPIYKIKVLSGKYTAEVNGFAGYYENVKYQKSEGATTNDENQAEQEIFDMRFKNIQKMAGLNFVSTEEKSSYLIDSKGECCDDKGSKGSGGKYGDVHLLHTTKNTNSILIDQYFKLVSGKESKGVDKMLKMPLLQKK